MYVLAEQYQLDVNMLMAYNQHISNPMQALEGMQVTIPSMGIGQMGVEADDAKGNVCAYVPDKPVSYNKFSPQFWPSDDYLIGYGSHTKLVPSKEGSPGFHLHQVEHAFSPQSQQQQPHMQHHQMHWNSYPRYY